MNYIKAILGVILFSTCIACEDPIENEEFEINQVEHSDSEESVAQKSGLGGVSLKSDANE